MSVYERERERVCVCQNAWIRVTYEYVITFCVRSSVTVRERQYSHCT